MRTDFQDEFAQLLEAGLEDAAEEDDEPVSLNS